MPQPGTFGFAETELSVNEGSLLQFEIVRVGGSEGAASVSIRTFDGTAVAGTEYEHTTLTIDFADAPDGFNPDEGFVLFVDPDGYPGPSSVAVGTLAGVLVTFTFEDGSTFVGEFVDDPAPGAGLVLEPVECLLIVGDGPGDQAVLVGSHLFESQIGGVEGAQ